MGTVAGGCGGQVATSGCGGGGSCEIGREEAAARTREAGEGRSCG